jgi:voltage-gated potassium channel
VNRLTTWERRFAAPVLIAALLVPPVIVVEQSGAGESWRQIAGVANWLIWLVFALELVVLTAVAPDRLRWLAHHPLEVAIVLLTPPFLPASLQAARVLRLARLARLLRLAPLLRKLFSIDGVRYAAMLAVMTALGGGAAYAAAEGSDVSTWDGVWWAITTMTTVGYGDLSPETDLGRVIALAVMLVGIGFVAVLTAAMAERFVRSEVEGVEEDIAEVLDEATQDVFADLAEIAQRLSRIEASLRVRSPGSAGS